MASRSLKLCALLASGLFTFACSGDDDDTTVDPDRDAGVPRDAGVRDAGDGVRDGGDGTRDGGDETRDAGEARDGGEDLSQAIVFLHTNDEHSHMVGFAPNIDDYPTASTMDTIKGGILRRATVLQTLENEARTLPGRPPVVRVGAGDLVMGSLFHLGNLQFGVDYALAGTLQYDVLTLGNHEFDFGVDFLQAMIERGTLVDPLNFQFGTLRIPLVVSNIRFSMTSGDDDGLEALYGGGMDQPIVRTVTQQHGDVLVGFVGVVGLDAAFVAPFKQPLNFSLAVDDQTTCQSDAQCPGSICVPPADDPTAASGNCALDPTGQDATVNFPAMVADIASAVAELRAANVDMVVAVSHAGINEREVNTLQMMGMGLENAMVSEEIILALGVDQALSQAGVPGIDLIIGGHSHTTLNAPLTVPNANSGITTHIVQAGDYGRWIGKVLMTRASPTDPWTIDANYSGLEPVDGSVQAQSNLVIEGFVEAIVEGLEETGIATAGDGSIFPGEQCDTTPQGAPFLPNGGQCLGVIPGATGGTLQCFGNRQLDTSQCILAQIGKEVCGDNLVEGAEQCDGTTIGFTCQQLGYEGGNLGCHTNCTLDTSACTPNFLSLLEIVANFQLDQDEMPVVWGPTSQRGDLYNYPLGTTTFDVGEKVPSNESNLANLVADANRFASNNLVPSHAQDPVEVYVVANGVIRDGLYQGATGVLGIADLFRVVPLGVSPVEQTPGHPLVDFYVTAAELKVAFELGLSLGTQTGSFWLGYSGARIEYDLSLPVFDPANPTTTGQVTRVDLIDPSSTAWDDTNATYETLPMFDIANGGFTDPNRLLHVGTDAYIALYIAGYGLCPRDAMGNQFPHCRACTANADCTVPDSVCDIGGTDRCVGGNPVAFSVRTTVPTAAVGITQELKEFLALTTYVRRLPGDALPTNYSENVPRRICCVGNACPADGSRTCPARPMGN